MKKEILKFETVRYQKLPAWLTITLACLLAILLAALGQTLGIALLVSFILASNQDVPELHFQLAAFLGIALLLFAWVKLYEKRPIRSLGFSKGNAVTALLKGWGVGTLFLSSALCLSYIFGGVKLTALDFSLETVGYVLSTLPFWLIQSGTEELLMRGWLLPLVHKRSNLAIAIAVTSSLFGLLHLSNDNVTLLSILSIILSGLMMGLYTLKTDNIWGVSALHAAWNFTQGNLFGVAVSGNDTGASLLTFTANDSAASWISGGQFGIEGTLFAILVELTAAGIFLYQIKQEK